MSWTVCFSIVLSTDIGWLVRCQTLGVWGCSGRGCRLQDYPCSRIKVLQSGSLSLNSVTTPGERNWRFLNVSSMWRCHGRRWRKKSAIGHDSILPLQKYLSCSARVSPAECAVLGHTKAKKDLKHTHLIWQLTNKLFSLMYITICWVDFGKCPLVTEQR